MAIPTDVVVVVVVDVCNGCRYSHIRSWPATISSVVRTDSNNNSGVEKRTVLTSDVALLLLRATSTFAGCEAAHRT